MSRLIWDSDAIDALKLFGAEHNAIAVIKGLPSAEVKGDLISRQDVLKLIRTLPSEEGMTKGLLEMSVKQLPSAEPEIIRCKDCEYFRTPKDENNYCDHDFAGIRHVPFDDDYCSYAERKII